MPESNWMAGLKDNIRLNQIVFPATHDSGMSLQSWAGAVQNAINPLAWIAKGATSTIAAIDDKKSGRAVRVFHDNFVTQYVNVENQLACGARQFDLRITRHNGTHRAYHGHAGLKIVGMRRYGEKWKDMCAGIARFMAANPSEVLILKMDKQKTGNSGIAKKIGFGWTKSTIQMLVKALKDARYTRRFDPIKAKFVDQETIGNLRGRILLCSKQKTLLQWRPIVSEIPAIQLCLWSKDETGQHPEDAITSPRARISIHTDNFPTYLLLGGAKAKGSGDDSRSNVLDKQATMRNVFAGIIRGQKAGMRGIWFNTYSYLRDIKTYSEEIWKPQLKGSRDALWLQGDAIQNVASVDFITQDMGDYIIGKNPTSNWQ